ncbi:MAG: VWA domain-containing protein [Mangrovibacterium sp.]|nr:VWA domain-containing protein [Mangrovibacterium sp.]
MEMFRFANSEYLYGLLIIPVLIILFMLIRISRKKALAKFAKKEILSELMPDASKTRPVVRFFIWLFSVAAIILAIARPQFGSKLKTEKRKGVELIIALDVSNSMLAEDIQPNRLERAKMAISRMVDNLNDDKIGLIVFAGDAYTQLPITTDYSSAKLFLNAVNTGFVPRQGTAIGAAIQLAVNSFSPQFAGNKAVIIITDGENHEDDAIGAASAASEKGIVVHTLGMGLPEGAPIPVYQNGQKDFRKDKDGQVVVTKLDEPMLQRVAASGKGIYVRANNAQVGLNTLFNEIEKMEGAEVESRIYSEYEDQFQWFIGFALALLFMNFLILERKNKYLKNINLFGR